MSDRIFLKIFIAIKKISILRKYKNTSTYPSSYSPQLTDASFLWNYICMSLELLENSENRQDLIAERKDGINAFINACFEIPQCRYVDRISKVFDIIIIFTFTRCWYAFFDLSIFFFFLSLLISLLLLVRHSRFYSLAINSCKQKADGRELANVEENVSRNELLSSKNSIFFSAISSVSGYLPTIR